MLKNSNFDADEHRADVLVVYGSETGNGYETACEVALAAHEAGSKRVCVLTGSEFAPWLTRGTSSLVIFCLATAGDGEHPQNFDALWRLLFRDSCPRLEFLHFAVFGLGDSKYPKFCFPARALHGRLMSLGAHPLVPQVHCGDDRLPVGWEIELYAFLSNLRQVFSQGVVLGPKAHAQRRGGYELNVNASDRLTAVPCHAFVLGNERVSSLNHFQDIRLMRLLVRSPEHGSELKNWKFRFGDYVKISIDNEQREYSRASTPNRIFYLYLKRVLQKHEIPLRDVHIEKLDELSAMTDDGIEARLAYSGRERLTSLEVVGDFLVSLPSSSSVDALTIVDEVHEMIAEDIPWRFDRSRKYSLANVREGNSLRLLRSFSAAQDRATWCVFRCALMSGLIVDILYSVVDYKTPLGRRRKGFCTKYLASLCPGSIISSVSLERHWAPNVPYELLQAESRFPVVAISTGVGAAPFLGLANSGRRIDTVVCGIRNRLSDSCVTSATCNMTLIGSTFWAESRPDLEHSRDGSGKKQYVQDMVSKPPVLERIISCLKARGVLVFCGRSYPTPYQIVDNLKAYAPELSRLIDVARSEGRVVFETWG